MKFKKPKFWDYNKPNILSYLFFPISLLYFLYHFIRNKLPRTVLRSKIKFKAGLVAIGGGYYATGGEIIQRYLDNLPKKLYYSDVEPSTFRLNGATIRKL